MSQKYAGYFLLIVAFICYKLRYTFFLAFLNPELIIIIAIIIAITGTCLVISIGQNKKVSKLHEEALKKLKSTSEKIILTANNCEVRENNYYEQVADNSLNDVTVADALYDPNRNVQQNYIQQTAIIYYYNNKGGNLRLTSQTFPFNKERLIYFLNSGNVILYVDKSNPADYAFEITD